MVPSSPPVRFGILGAAAIAPRALVRPPRAAPEVRGLAPPAPARCGVLGAAPSAPRALVRPSRAVPEVSVMAVAARDEKRARAFAAAHAVPAVHAHPQAPADAPATA